jgi:hypothetical protein
LVVTTGLGAKSGSRVLNHLSVKNVSDEPKIPSVKNPSVRTPSSVVEGMGSKPKVYEGILVLYVAGGAATGAVSV